MKNQIISYKGKKVKVMEKEENTVYTLYTGSRDQWWVRALEPVEGHDKGDEFMLREAQIKKALRNQ